MKYFGVKAILVAGIFAINPVSAHAEDMPFNGNVADICTITLTQAGTLDLRPNLRRLTSRSGPGIPGRADVVASSNGFTMSVDAPTSFDTEPAEDVASPETFRAWHRSNGATVFGNTRNPQAINSGLNRVRIHMDARKPVGNVFHAGDYSATVVLRCE